MLSELFNNCNLMSYNTIGDSVNYAFIEENDHLFIYFQGSSQISD